MAEKSIPENSSLLQEGRKRHQSSPPPGIPTSNTSLGLMKFFQNLPVVSGHLSEGPDVPITGKSPCPGPESEMALELIPLPVTRALGPWGRPKARLPSTGTPSAPSVLDLGVFSLHPFSVSSLHSQQSAT